MLEVMSDLPANVLGLNATGKVSAEDYRSVLVPAVETKLARHKKLRLLYVLGADFDRFTADAAWEDAKVGMRHFTSFERIAVATDVDWVRQMIKAFGFVVPGDVRVYGSEEVAAARAWISEPRSRGKLEFALDREKGVLILEPEDELEASDFERVSAEIDPYIAERGGLAGIVVIAGEFPGWDDFAALSSHLRFVREHHRKIGRVALVTTSRFLSVLPRITGLFVAAEVKQFTPTERAAALAWAATGPGGLQLPKA